jgi:hypothetical protein
MTISMIIDVILTVPVVPLGEHVPRDTANAKAIKNAP